MPNYIKFGGLISTESEPKQQIDRVVSFLIHNNEQHYFLISPGKEYFDHTLYYHLRKQKPASIASTSVNHSK